MPVLAQFPLGSVLFPSQVLPLHVFEERYRTLMDHLLDDGVPGPGSEFGVPLIERGFEVGGGDVRSTAGTVARIVEAEQFDDGRWVVVTVGVRRYSVLQWLDDDPYPRAEVEDWPDRPCDRDLRQQVQATTKRFTRCLATAAEAGYDVGPIPVIADDPEVAVMQLAAMAPVSQHDRQAFLMAPGPEERLPLIDEALTGAQEMFEFELREG